GLTSTHSAFWLPPTSYENSVVFMMLTIDPRVAVTGGCPSTEKRTSPAMTTKTDGVSGCSRRPNRLPGAAELYVASCSGSLMICSCQSFLPECICLRSDSFHSGRIGAL